MLPNFKKIGFFFNFRRDNILFNIQYSRKRGLFISPPEMKTILINSLKKNKYTEGYITHFSCFGFHRNKATGQRIML